MANYLAFDESVSLCEETAKSIARKAVEAIKKELPEEALRYDVVKAILDLAKEELNTARIY